jgi:hypothetical protein
LGAIGPAITQARSDITGTLDPAIAALTAGRDVGASALGAGQAGGLAALQSGVGAATAAFDPLAAAASGYSRYYAPAQTAYNTALGLGPQGTDPAAAFRNTPGYQFALNTGLESILRNANVGGGAAGGNLLRESQTFGTGLADQTFQNYLANLLKVPQLYAPLETSALGTVGQGRAQAALTGGTGAANIYTGTGGRLADLYSRTGGDIAGAYGTAGGRLADLASRGGLAEADVYRGTGTNIANLLNQIASGQAGATTSLAQPYAGTYATEAAGQAQGSANLWNLITGGARLAAGGGFIPSGSYTPWRV